jgi:Tfp pilus assembly protein PilN
VKVRLNLATAPLENNRRFLLGATLVGLFALALFVLLAQQAYRDWRASSEIRAEMGELQSQMRDLRNARSELERSFKRPEARRTMDRAAFLNGLIEQRSFPWTRIFMDLERLLPEGVRVISIAPEMKEGRVEVKLVVGVTSDEAKLEFLKTLEGAKEFTGVQVVSETRPSRPDQTDRVVLELFAWYSAS